MAAAVAYGKTGGGAYWFQRGQQRLHDQLQHLVKRENGYAVFIENSSGYHQGIQRLIAFAAKLEQLADQPRMAHELLAELQAWSAVFTYPDGRLPAHGDTVRFPNPEGHDRKPVCEEQNLGPVLLPESGYFVYKGASKRYTWFVGMVATNSSETHKHQDDTSLVFWLDGIEWLIDPSFYSHDYAEELPVFFRSAAAHNMVSIPDGKYSITPEPSRTSINYVDSEESSYRVQALNYSYEGVEIRRHLHVGSIDAAPFVEVTDSCKPLTTSTDRIAKNSTQPILTFHFGDGVQIQRKLSEDSKFSFELTHPACERALILSIRHESDSDGWGSASEPSFSGLGFMQSIDTQILRIPVPLSTDCQWSIHVK
jgi:hypothetical protein